MGLAGIKKLLRLAAIIIPGVIGYFKLCYSQQHNNYLPEYNTNYPQYNPQGLGTANHHYYSSVPSSYQYSKIGSTYNADPYTNYYRENQLIDKNKDTHSESDKNAQNLAYDGYSEYRNKNIENII